MKNSLFVILVTGLLMSGCLKDPEDLGYYNTMVYTGTVVDGITNTAMPNIKVIFNNDETVNATTDNSGKFSIKVNLDDLVDGSSNCLIIRGDANHVDKKLSLKASKGGEYDYGTIQLWSMENNGYEELPTIEYASHTYKIGKLSPQTYTISNAISYVHGLHIGGYSDWNLAPIGLLDVIARYTFYFSGDSEYTKERYDLHESLRKIEFWGYEDSETDGYIIPYRCRMDGNYEVVKNQTTEGVAYVIPVRLIR